MDSNLKTYGRFFQVFAHVSEIKLVEVDLASFLLSKCISFCSLSSLKTKICRSKALR